jgi:hypothetical protein
MIDEAREEGTRRRGSHIPVDRVDCLASSARSLRLYLVFLASADLPSVEGH